MSAKEEAIRSITHAETMLAGDEPVAGITKRLLASALEYAKEQVALIPELKRVRKAPARVE